jgi:hypothetical protein
MATNKFKNIIVALGTLIAIGVVNSSFAADYKSTSEIKYVGNSDNLPVFQLDLNNAAKDEYFITIRNSDKKVLLREKLKGEKVVRRYKLNTEELSRIEGTTFEVINKKTKETLVYTISGGKIITENKSDFKNLMKLLKVA